MSDEEDFENLFRTSKAGWDLQVSRELIDDIVTGARTRRRRTTQVVAIVGVVLVVSVLGAFYRPQSPGGGHVTAETGASVASVISTPASVPTPGPSSMAPSSNISVVSPDKLTDHGGWLLQPVTGQTAALPASAAVAAAAGEVRGSALAGQAPVKVALALVTDSLTARGVANVHLPLKDRLVWVVEADNVLIPVAGPAVYTGPHTVVGTVQWLIDAVTGQYIEARDFS